MWCREVYVAAHTGLLTQRLAFDRVFGRPRGAHQPARRLMRARAHAHLTRSLARVVFLVEQKPHDRRAAAITRVR